MFLILRDYLRRRGYTRTGNWFGAFEGKYSLRRSIRHSSASHVLQLRAARNLISVILPSHTSPVPTKRQNQITIFFIPARLILVFLIQFSMQIRSEYLNIFSICFVFHLKFGYFMLFRNLTFTNKDTFLFWDWVTSKDLGKP